MRIYLAGPLFTDAERAFNEILCKKLEDLGHNVFLPQKYVAEHVDFSVEGWQMQVFKKNCEEIQAADIVIAILDGAIVDDGTSWEIGHAYSLGKVIYGVRTDFRIVGLEGSINLMISQSLTKMFVSTENLLSCDLLAH